MTKRVEITAGIMEPYAEAPTDTIVRFHFTDRWESHGLPGSYIEVSFSRDNDAVVIRSGVGTLTMCAPSSNSFEIAPIDMYGGETEVLRLRREKLELVQKLNAAQDVFNTRKRKP